MSDRPIPAELSQRVSALARALVTAARSCSLYPADHPAVHTAAARRRDALAEASAGRVLSLGVTPDTLLIEGTPALEEDSAAAPTATRAPAEHAADPQSIASGGSRVALDRLADSTAFAETIDMLAGRPRGFQHRRPGRAVHTVLRVASGVESSRLPLWRQWIRTPCTWIQ